MEDDPSALSSETPREISHPLSLRRTPLCPRLLVAFYRTPLARGSYRLVGVATLLALSSGFPSASAAPPRAPEPKSGPSAGSEPRCEVDADCADGTICEQGACRRIQRPLNLLYLYYRSGDRRMQEILGVYWHRRGDSGYRVLFPLYWHFWRPESRARVVFPFYWRFDTRTRGSSSTTRIVPPLLTGWTRASAPDRSRGLALGLYYWHRRGVRGQPAYFATRVLLPLFAHRSTNESSFTWAFPLTFHWRNGHRSSLVLFPLLYRRTSADSSLTLNLVPPLVYHRSRASRQLIAPPLVYHVRGKASSHTVVLPFLYRRAVRGGRSTRIYSPLFFYERDADARLRHLALFAPPYYRRRDAERDIDAIPPLFWRWRNRAWQTTTWVAGPLVWNADPDGSSRTFFPFYWHFRDERYGSSTSVLFPLAYHRRRSDGSRFSMLFPCYWSRGKSSWSAGVLPLLFTGRANERGHAVLFPLFWHLRRGARRTTVLLPAYYRAHERGWSAALFPLFFAGRDRGDSHQVLFPLYWHFRSRQDRFDTHVVGPAFHSRSARGRLFGLLPLFVAGRRDTRRFAAVPPLLFYYSKQATGSARKLDWTALVALYYGHRRGAERVDRLLPFFYYSRDGARARATLALFPLAYYARERTRSTFLTPLAAIRRDDTRKLREGFVGPVLWRRTARHHTTVLLPLFVHHRDLAARSETSIVLPLAVRFRSPTKTADVLFPLFWRLTDPKQRSLVVFPFFWQLRQRAGRDVDVVFPLYWRVRTKRRQVAILGPAFWSRTGPRRVAGFVPLGFYRRNERGSSFAALPFFYYGHDFKQRKRTFVAGPAYFRSYRQGYAAGLAPLLWHKRTPESQHTVVAPIFWHFSRPKERSSFTLAGPLLLRHKKDERSWALLPLLYRARDDRGGATTALAPLFYYRSEAAKRAFYTPLMGLYRSPDYAIWYAGPYLRWRSRWRALDLLFPLALRSTNRPARSTTVVALPAYFGSWRADASLHIVFPLLWQRRTLDASKTVVFPFYWDFNDRYRQRTVALLPLFVHSTDQTQRSRWLFTPPAIWIRWRPQSTDAVVFPLFWHFGRRNDGTTIGFPLYWDFRARERRSTVVFPFYWRFDRSDSRTTVLFNSYYWRSKRNAAFNYHFFPFFQLERRRLGDIRLEILAGLFGYERIGRNRLLTLFFFPFQLAPASRRAPPPQPRRVTPSP